MKTGNWLSAVIICLGVFAVTFCAYQLRLAVDSKTWPRTQGTVLKSYVAPFGMGARGDYMATIIYKYTINGQVYKSHRLSVIQTASKQLTSLRGFVAEHPEGTQVTVYFSPNDPSLSVLVPGLTDTVEDYSMLIVGIFLTVIGAGVRSFVSSNQKAHGKS